MKLMKTMKCGCGREVQVSIDTQHVVCWSCVHTRATTPVSPERYLEVMRSVEERVNDTASPEKALVDSTSVSG